MSRFKILQALITELEKAPRPFVIMGVGIQGSGKSTVFRPFAEELGAEYLCTDDIRGELTGDPSDQTVNAEAWKLLYERAADRLKNGRSLVIDATHAERYYRRDGIRRYRDYGAQMVVALCIETSLQTALERNSRRERVVPEHAIRRMAHQLAREPVILEEGFDDIVRVRNDA